MADRDELEEGMAVEIVGRSASGDRQPGTLIDAGDVQIRVPGSGPRTTVRTYDDTAMVRDESGRFVVAPLSDIEIP